MTKRSTTRGSTARNRQIGAPAVAAALVAASAIGLPNAVAGASVARVKVIPCSVVSSATVSAALGTKVAKPSSVVNGAVDVCTYKGTGGAIATVIVRFETGMSKSGWTSSRKAFDSNGEPTTTVTGLGNAAFSSVIGSGEYQTSTISILKGSTNLQISAPGTLTKVEALAKKVLPSL